MNRFYKGMSIMRLRALITLLAIGSVATACELDLQNPNAVTEEDVLTSFEGVIALAVGMQDIYAGNVDNFVQAPALISDEWGTKSLSLLAWTSLLTGENFDDGYGTVEAPWAASYRVIGVANDLIAAAPEVGLAPSFAGAIQALGHLYRGMALGQLYLHYERAPLAVDQDNPPAEDRDAVLQEAIASLERADSVWATVDPDELAGFESRVVGPGFMTGETIDAMLARFHLFAGNWEEAQTAAEQVPEDVLSVLDYAGTDINPIYDLSFQANYVAGLQSFVDGAEAGDERVAFWVDLSAPAPQSNTDSALVELGQYATPTDPYPLFLPDEMKLIRAEAHTRQGEYGLARDLVNEVRTQCTAAVEEPVACLGEMTVAELDSEEELLTQIAYERAYELYMQGLRWEDMRRLDAYLVNDAWLDFLPIPQQECLANTSITC